MLDFILLGVGIYFSFIYLFMLVIFIILILFITSGLLTLLERKILGLVQSRISNYKFNIFGLLQFFIDFIKLINKSILYSNNFNILNSLSQSLLFIIISIYGFVLISFLIQSHQFQSLFIFFILVLLFLNSIMKISSLSFLIKDYNIIFLFKIKAIIIISESILLILDFIFVIIFTCQGLFELSVFGCMGFYILLLVIVFVVLLIKSFRSPFDFLERESEAVNSFFLDSSGIEYSLWTLLEYVFIFNNSLYFIYFFNIITGFIISICIMFLLLTMNLICFIRGVLIRLRFDRVLICIMFLDMSFFIMLFLLFII